jgi:hypothetical protein
VVAGGRAGDANPKDAAIVIAMPSVLEPMVPILARQRSLILTGYSSRNGTAFELSAFCRMAQFVLYPGM